MKLLVVTLIVGIFIGASGMLSQWTQPVVKQANQSSDCIDHQADRSIKEAKNLQLDKAGNRLISCAK